MWNALTSVSTHLRDQIGQLTTEIITDENEEISDDYEDVQQQIKTKNLELIQYKEELVLLREQLNIAEQQQHEATIEWTTLFHKKEEEIQNLNSRIESINNNNREQFTQKNIDIQQPSFCINNEISNITESSLGSQSFSSKNLPLIKDCQETQTENDINIEDNINLFPTLSNKSTVNAETQTESYNIENDFKNQISLIQTLQEKLQQEESQKQQIIQQISKQNEIHLKRFNSLQIETRDAFEREEKARSKQCKLEVENEKLMEKIQKLKEKNDSLIDINERLSEKENILSSEAICNERVIEELRNTIDNQDIDTSNFNQILSEKDNEIDNLKKYANELSYEHDKNISQIIEYQSQNQHLSEELQNALSKAIEMDDIRIQLIQSNNEKDFFGKEVDRLQTVLEKINDRDSQQNKQIQNLQLEVKEAQEQISTFHQIQQENKELVEAKKQMKHELSQHQQYTVKLENDRYTLQMGLEKTIKRLHEFTIEENLVDRRLIIKLLTSYFCHPNQRNEIINLFCKMLQVTPEEEQILLDHHNRNWSNWLHLPQIFSDNQIKSNSIGELWVNFLLDETNDNESLNYNNGTQYSKIQETIQEIKETNEE